MFKFLLPAPHLPEIADPDVVKSTYKYWRMRVMVTMFVGYMFYYFTRKGFIFVMPGIMQELHLDKSQVGMVGTIYALVYGLSKFFNGILSDQSNPRYFMGLGLICTGILNICVGFSSSLFFLALFWGLNGWFQGCGWPPCVRLLTHWYSRSERGSWWSSVSVSQNVGAFLIPWIVGGVQQFFGWRTGICTPGIICIFGGFFLMYRLADTPQSVGLPPMRGEKHEEQELSSRQLLASVLKNKSIWTLAIVYFFIYFIRSGVEQWTALFLIESKGYAQISASGVVSLFEAGGFVGGLSAGWISDRLFRARRGPVNVLFALLLIIALISFWAMPEGSAWLASSLLFTIGFASFGPQLLIGIAVAELVHKKASATANGFAGWVAYFGGASAGFPLGKAIDKLGWEGFFYSMVIASGVAIALLLVNLREKKSYIVGSSQ